MSVFTGSTPRRPRPSRLTLPVMAVVILMILIALPISAAGPDPTHFYLQSLSYGGSGCTQGSVGAAFSAPRTSLMAVFDSFVAYSGPGVPIPQNRKNCQLNVNFKVPVAPASSLVTLTVHGFAQLPAGKTAEMTVIIYWDGAVVKTVSNTLAGPTFGNYTHTASVLLTSTEVDPSTRPLNVNSQVEILGAPPTSEAQATVDFINVFSDGGQS